MEKLDRLGWAAGFAFKLHGVSVGVRTNQTSILDILSNHLPPGWKPSTTLAVDRLFSFKVGGEGKHPGTRHFHLVYDNFVRLTRTHSLADALETFETSLQVYIATRAHRRIYIRAGVVGWRGQALIIPGSSFSGKSTLVSELIKAGATYYSDEYAVFNYQGRVHPYASPLKLRTGLNQRLLKHSIEDFGAIAGTRPLPAGLILLTQYKESAHWKPKLISAGQAFLALLSNSISIDLNPQQTFASLRRVAAQTIAIKSVRGEANEVAPILLNLDWNRL